MTLLLLAGTGEARAIAEALAQTETAVIASLAGATRQPASIGVPTRIGGFGGEDEFRAFLADHNITAVLDATHPFAARITERTARVCADLQLPYAILARPAWTAMKADRWTSVATLRDAAEAIPAGAVVFLATGRQSLMEFENLNGEKIFARVVDPPRVPFPFETGEFIVGRPPFSVADEEALFARLGITHLVVKNAGGDAGRTKLDAARKLGLQVVIVDRPQSPSARRFDTIEDALKWVANL